jgi:hypothetical protein
MASHCDLGSFDSPMEQQLVVAFAQNTNLESVGLGQLFEQPGNSGIDVFQGLAREQTLSEPVRNVTIPRMNFAGDPFNAHRCLHVTQLQSVRPGLAASMQSEGTIDASAKGTCLRPVTKPL